MSSSTNSKKNATNTNKPFTFSPPPPSSSQQQQPFSFTAPKSSTTSTSSSTLQPPLPPPPLLEQVRQLFHKDFLRLVNQWKDIHEQSTETLTEFLSFKNLLQQTSVVVVGGSGSGSSSSNGSSSEQQSSLQVKQYLRKLEQFHTMLSQCITRDLKQLLFDMRALAQKIKSCVQSHVHSANQMETVAMDNGDYGFLCSAMDYVRFVSIYVSMHENDYDMKCAIVQSIHEEESNFVLNSYLISWKKQPFRNVDVLRGMEMEWNRDEKMRAKLGLPIMSN